MRGHPVRLWVIRATVLVFGLGAHSAVEAASFCVAPQAAGGNTGANLVGNPSFEADTVGWKAYGGSTIQRMAGGVEGTFALEVRGPTSTAAFGINDGPNWVATAPAAGTRFRVTAWVLAEASTGPARLRPARREVGACLPRRFWSWMITPSTGS